MNLENSVALSINKNIISLNGHRYVSAGQYQHRGLWTKDFCLAVPGLLSVGLADIVKNQLQLILENINDIGLCPLVLDSVNPQQRRKSGWQWLLLRTKKSQALTWPLRAYFEMEPQTQNGKLTQNLFVLKAFLEYSAKTQDIEFFLKNEKTLVQVYRYYEPFLKNGHVDEFDFQTNLLYSNITEELCLFSQFHFCQERAPFLRRSIDSTYKNPQNGLYSTDSGHQLELIEDQLLVLKWNWLRGDSRRELWQKIIQSNAWKSLFVAPYNSSNLALAFKVSLMMNDTAVAQELLKVLSAFAEKNPLLSEEYDIQMNSLSSWSTFSDEPHLLTASLIAESYDFLKNLKSVLGLR